MTIEEQIRQRRMEIQNAVSDNILKGFESDIEKAQENEYTEYSVNDLIKAGVLEYDDSIEKAVYADTPQNRKLGRVGQEYHRGKGKKVEEKSAKKGVKTEEKKPTDKKQKAEKNPVKLAAREFDKIVEPTNNWDDDDWNDMKKNDKLVKDLKSVVEKYNLSKKDFKEAFGHHAYGLDISYEDLTKANHIDIEKAVYADTAENRKLGRVGQEYKRGKGKDVKISYSKVLSLMENNTKFSGEIESLIDKYLGEKLKKKFGSTDMADIYDAVGEDKFDSFMETMVKKLPSDKLQEVYNKYVK